LDKHGFAMPFFVWEHKSIIYAVDGHTRKEILIQRENVPDQLPAVFIDAKNKNDAIEILLEVYNQKHNPIDGTILVEFLKTEAIETETLNVRSLNVVNEPRARVPKDKGEDNSKHKKSITKPGDVYEIGKHKLIVDKVNLNLVDSIVAGVALNFPSFSVLLNGNKLASEDLKKYINIVYEQ
jgi:hypothetical protein